MGRSLLAPPLPQVARSLATTLGLPELNFLLREVGKSTQSFGDVMTQRLQVQLGMMERSGL